MDKLYSIILFFGISLPLLSTPIEKITEGEIYVGDSIQYSIEWQEGEITDVILEEGRFYEDNSRPTYEIQTISKDKNKTIALILFFVAGDFYLPVSWKENGIETNSKFKINVKSQLSGQETEIEDINPPILFSGPFALRLIGLIAFTLVNVYLLYALYLYWKSKPKIVDAVWEKNPKLLESAKRLYQLEQYLQSETITEKELTFKISEYLKEVFSEKFQENLLGCTDTEFLTILHDKTHIPDSSIRQLRLYFRDLKYNQNQQTVSKADADKIWTQIKKDFII
ncbi:hypothetical protein AB3N60_17765 [Leptospira sp. WS39.C2]